MVGMTLTEFLLARIAEDEAVARAPYPFDSRFDNDYPGSFERERLWDAQPHGRLCGWHLGEQIVDECSCNYPARVLAECEAKRRIVERITDGCPHGIPAPTPERPNRRVRPGGWCIEHCDAILLDLALPYADHPDYLDEWRA